MLGMVKDTDNELSEIIKRALTQTVTDIGQLSKAERQTLTAYVKRGHLSKGKGGPYPMLKTVYAIAGFDFAAHRQAHVDYMMYLARLDRQALAARS